MTTPEKDLFRRALGDDEPPPMQLDLDALAATGARRHRRLRTLTTAGAAVSVLVIAGVVAVSVGHRTVAPADPAPVSSSTAAAATTADATTSTVGPTQLPVTTAAPTDLDVAYCYRTPDLASTDPTQRVSEVLAGGNVAAMVVEICHGAWVENRYGWQTETLPNGKRADPPGLVACTVPDPESPGSTVVGVFPGTEQTCAVLGVPVAPR